MLLLTDQSAVGATAHSATSRRASPHVPSVSDLIQLQATQPSVIVQGQTRRTNNSPIKHAHKQRHGSADKTIRARYIPDNLTRKSNTRIWLHLIRKPQHIFK